MVSARPGLLPLLIPLLLKSYPTQTVQDSKATKKEFQVQNLRSDWTLGEGDSFVETCPSEVSDTEEDHDGHVRNDRKKEQ